MERNVSARAPCSVCTDNADGMHFGALVCCACSAFFRRSIADQKVPLTLPGLSLHDTALVGILLLTFHRSIAKVRVG